MAEVVALLTPKIVKPAEYSHLDGSDHFFTNLNTPNDVNDIEKLLCHG